MNEIPQMKVEFICAFLCQPGWCTMMSAQFQAKSRSRRCESKLNKKKREKRRRSMKKLTTHQKNSHVYARMHSSHNITPQSMIFLNLLAHYSFDIAFISCSLIIASKSLTYKSHSNKINFLIIAVTVWLVWYVVALWRVVTFSLVRVIIRPLSLSLSLFLPRRVLFTSLLNLSNQTDVVVNVYLFYLHSLLHCFHLCG